MKLGEYINSMSHLKRAACVHDCSTLPAGWCVANGYSDPMKDFRGSYTTEEESIKIVKDWGGLENIFDHCLDGIDVKRSINPIQGSIGVVTIGEFQAGAIYIGPKWVFVGGKGLVISHVRDSFITAVWNI